MKYCPSASEYNSLYCVAKEEFLQFAKILKKGTVCPIKAVHEIDNVDGIATRTTTIMTGYLGDGYSIHKTIEIDDTVSTTVEASMLYKNGKLVACYGDGFTPIRCGVMACVAIGIIAESIPAVLDKPIGIIGNGRISQSVCKAAKAIFGISNIVIHGKKGNYGKNYEEFANICEAVEVDENFSKLEKCGVVITCTSSFTPENLIETAQLKNADAIISLDMGYILGESFRKERRSYTDYVEQAEAHYCDEFPFDENIAEMKQLGVEAVQHGSVIYMYGIGIADAVVARFLYERNI